MKACSIEGCGNPSRVRGWCNKHYNRWKSTGDPLQTKIAAHTDSIYDRLVRYTQFSDSGCWLWTGAIKSTGYGEYNWEGLCRSAHRLWYETMKGEIPDGLVLDHLCSVKHCVNPSHMEAVTLRENIQRYYARLD